MDIMLQIRLSGLLHSDENCALKVEDSVLFLLSLGGGLERFPHPIDALACLISIMICLLLH